MPHTEIDKKTLSAPNPISTVYKKLAFFDSADNKLCFTNDANLKDMEIVEISNPIHFTQGLTIGGTLKGEPRADGGSEIDLSGSIAQLFGDIYKGNSQGGGAASNYISTVGTKWGDADKGVIWSINQEYDQRTAADRDINQELDGIEKLIVDQAWNYASSLVPQDKKFAYKAINSFSIGKEKFSESSSKRKFAILSREFRKDKLNFYTDDMYYPFRNKLLETFSKHISNPSNLVYFLNTVGYYTFDDADSTPCPYKLLIGGEKKSMVKEVTSDEGTKDIFLNKSPQNLSNVFTKYDNKSQTFNLKFTYKPLKVNVQAPIVMRTRAAGGWSGKSLYVTTSGFKKK